MAENKHQHYLPAFYLYNFTNEVQRNAAKGKEKRETKIYHFDFAKNCIKERPIRKVAIEPYLYSHRSEDGNYDHSLDHDIQIVEDKAARAIQYFTDVMKSALKEKPQNIKIENTYMDNILDLLFWQIKRHPDLISDYKANCEQFLAAEDQSTSAAKSMALEAIRQLGNRGEYDIKEELDKKNKIILCISSPDAHFITSDKPFVRVNSSRNNGIAVEGTEMYFPITSNMLLFMHNNGKNREFRLENDRPLLRKLNACIARHASNYLFGSSQRYLQKIVKVNR
jgi:hypothetical protein